jgi:putative SOS response-associated peptidase YedK
MLQSFPMCGRYRRTTADEEMALRFNVPIPLERDLPISWNTCTIITGEPNGLVREIHTRMPVILPEEHHH